MGVLIIGDVHGCYYTLRSLVEEHWRPQHDHLILVGDLLNKGPHSVKTWRYWLKLRNKAPQRVILLRGNHEQWFLEQSRRKSPGKQFRKLLENFEKKGLFLADLQRQISQLPLHWENSYLFVSHAGLSAESVDPYDLRKAHNLLHNRKKLQVMEKVQVCGHQVLGLDKPVFKPKENAWMIDTGAWCNTFLSALHFSEKGQKVAVLQLRRDTRDDQPPQTL